MAVQGFVSVAILLVALQLFLHECTGVSTGCVDKNPSCRSQAATGECRKNRAWMLANCRLSCGMCEEQVLKSIVTQSDQQIRYALQALALLGCGLLVALARLYFIGGVCSSGRKMNGKLVIITGGTSDIAVQVAISLAWRGAKVILGCRHVTRGIKAMGRVSTAAKSQLVQIKKLDLESLSSVRAFAKEVIEDLDEGDTIDVLINNASVTPGNQRHETADGMEQSFQVNFASHFLLTAMLSKKLKQSADGRVISMSSERHKHGNIDFGNLQGQHTYDAWQCFDQSKLCLNVFNAELARRMGSTCTALSVHPGYVMSSLSKNIPMFRPWLGRIVLKALGSLLLIMMCKSPRQAAETVIHAAVVEDMRAHNGGYLKDCQPHHQSPIAGDEGLAKKLWEITETLVGEAGVM